ncbi:MAG: tetratricopeptide (TPR) repeat protein [Rhodothermales bacterium]|jgi:tetratricopeptide (TPR) repeat protein
MRNALLALIIAIPVFGQTVRMSEDEIRQSYYSSYNYEKAQNYADAIKALQPAFRAFPQGYTLNLRLGWLYYLSGKYANAEQHYLTAVKVAPNSIEAKLGYSLPLLVQERYEDVEAVARQVLRVDLSNYFANLRLVVALRGQGKADTAEKVADAMLTLYPTDVALLSQKALLRIDAGDNATARARFQDILILDPQNVLAREQLKAL